MEACKGAVGLSESKKPDSMFATGGIKLIRGALLLSQEMQKGPPCFLSFLERGLGVAASNYLLHSTVVIYIVIVIYIALFIETILKQSC